MNTQINGTAHSYDSRILAELATGPKNLTHLRAALHVGSDRARDMLASLALRGKLDTSLVRGVTVYALRDEAGRFTAPTTANTNNDPNVEVETAASPDGTVVLGYAWAKDAIDRLQNGHRSARVVFDPVGGFGVTVSKRSDGRYLLTPEGLPLVAADAVFAGEFIAGVAKALVDVERH